MRLSENTPNGVQMLDKADDLGPVPYWDPNEEMRRLMAILERTYSGMLAAINALVMAHFDIDEDAEGFRVDDATTRRILHAAARRVVRITETTRQAIAETLQEGQARGYNTWQLAHGVPADGYAGIDGLFRETWAGRAEMVARTELQEAQRLSAIERYVASGLVGSLQIIDGCQWDDPCCQRNGTTIPLEAAPEVTLNHPRCTLVLVPVLREGIPPPVQAEASEQPALL
jgi:hypothetical protein